MPHGNHKEKDIIVTQKNMIKKSKHTDQKNQNIKIRQQNKKHSTIKLPHIQKTTNNMATVNPYLTIIQLNVNGLNFPIKDIEWLNGLKKRKEKKRKEKKRKKTKTRSNNILPI